MFTFEDILSPSEPKICSLSMADYFTQTEQAFYETHFKLLPFNNERLIGWLKP
jgi:hypothetical protein